MLKRNMTKLSSGQQVSWIEAGPPDGHAVVLLHGGGADNAALSWGATVEILAECGYHVVAPDHPGYGQSPKSRGYATMQNQVNYVNEFLGERGLEEYDLVGISMGGAMAIGHTLAHPDKVRRLGLIASYGYQATLAAQPFMMFGSWCPWLTETIQLMSWNPYTVGFGLMTVLSKSVVSDELAADVRAAALNTRALATFNEFQRHELGPLGNRTDYSDRLSEITQPVLLLHGEHDVIFPVSDAEKAQRLLPNARLEVLSGVGHWVQRDDPDRVHEVLMGFFSEARQQPVAEPTLRVLTGGQAA